MSSSYISCVIRILNVDDIQTRRQLTKVPPPSFRRLSPAGSVEAVSDPLFLKTRPLYSTDNSKILSLYNFNHRSTCSHCPPGLSRNLSSEIGILLDIQVCQRIGKLPKFSDPFKLMMMMIIKAPLSEIYRPCTRTLAHAL